MLFFLQMLQKELYRTRPRTGDCRSYKKQQQTERLHLPTVFLIPSTLQDITHPPLAADYTYAPSPDRSFSTLACTCGTKGPPPKFSATVPRPPQKMDESEKKDDFGFYYCDGDETMSPGKVDKKKDQERGEKWRKMFDDWDKSVKKGKVKERVRKGIPTEHRAQAWALLTGAKREMDANPNLFQQFLDRKEEIPEDTQGVMQRDLHRTLPNHSMFRDSETGGQAKLQRILSAYAVRDPDCGYVQGMGFIVSMLLVTGIEEKLAFYTISQLMSDKPHPVTKEPNPYHLRRLYLPGFPELKKMQFILSGLLEKFLPDLNAHFQKEGVDSSISASQWFLTLFIYQFPNHPYLLLRILDTFMSEGWKIMYRVSLCLLKLERATLLKMSMEQIYPHLKNLQHNSQPNVFMGEMLALSLKREHIDRLAEAYETQKLAGKLN